MLTYREIKRALQGRRLAVYIECFSPERDEAGEYFEMPPEAFLGQLDNGHLEEFDSDKVVMRTQVSDDEWLIARVDGDTVYVG